MKLEDWKIFIQGLFNDVSAKTAAAALVLALVLAGTVSRFMGGPPGSGQLGPPQQIAVISILIASFVLIWAVLFFIRQNYTIDIFSKVRKQISGRWIVTYSASVNYHSVENRIISCNIKENIIKRLEFEFETLNNPIFKNNSKHIVKDIALREVDANRYALFYYFETDRELVDTLQKALVMPTGNSVTIETLGMLEFESPTNSKQYVETMTGKWYDLNGNMMRILELIRMKNQAEARGQNFKPISLDSIPVSNIHFDADMGSVEFRYHGA